MKCGVLTKVKIQKSTNESIYIYIHVYKRHFSIYVYMYHYVPWELYFMAKYTAFAYMDPEG